MKRVFKDRDQMRKIQYIKKNNPIFNHLSKNKNQLTLYFTKLYMMCAIKIGTDLLNQYQKEKKTNQFEFSQLQKPSFESLDPEFKEIAKQLYQKGLCQNYKKKYGWDDESILNCISFCYLNFRESTVRFFFFLHSVNQALRFSKKLYSLFPEIKKEYTSFKQKNNLIPEVRNIYEHYDEYIYGGGRNKDKNYVIDEKQRSISSATGISGRIKKGNGEIDFIIGNRVSLRKSIQSVKKLLKYLILELESKIAHKNGNCV